LPSASRTSRKPHDWVDFYIWLRQKGRVGPFVEGFLCLYFGAFIVAFHHVWSGLPIVLTLVGWGQVLKGFVRFAEPQFTLRTYERIRPERAWEFRVAGVAALALGCLFAYMAHSR